MKKETLKSALNIFRSGRGYCRSGLAGLPVADARADQAIAQLKNDLPLREFRAYSVSQFIDAAYTVDPQGRYQIAQ